MSYSIDEIKEGDMLWVKQRKTNYEYGYGEVKETWTDGETGDDYFEYFCQINGGQRTGKISEIIMNPTARMLGKLQDCRKDVAEAMKGKF